MKGIAFLKKEMKEIIRTNKLFILPSVFLLFGFASPLTAKYMKEIMKAAGGEAYIGQLPDPQYLDAYAQFFSNLNSMCLIVMVLALAGTVVEEKTRGSAILVLTKGVSRTTFIVSKFISSLILYTVSYLLSLGACLYYTYVLFPQVFHENLWISILMFWLYGVFLLSMTIFSSTIGKSFTVSAVIGFVGYILASLSAYTPGVGDYMPGKLSGFTMGVLAGSHLPQDVWLPAIVTLILSCLFLVFSVNVFKKQEL